LDIQTLNASSSETNKREVLSKMFWLKLVCDAQAPSEFWIEMKSTINPWDLLHEMVEAGCAPSEVEE
jgi:hypothetical protein